KSLPKGTYRMASINAAANHQAVLVAVAQHGSLDDMVLVSPSRSYVGQHALTRRATGFTVQ
ncbi:uncharacterized protein B0H18DRAFT_886113, partial [Fomitopsis serialis]|uniref:uncharacterized protein n=1 Tax=Fomitopsis serialis TaxID=139415 RepID=UPI0020073295